MNKNEVKTYKIEGMDCASCASIIQMDLEDKGIKAHCSYAAGTLEIGSDVDINTVIEIVTKAGYNLIR